MKADNKFTIHYEYDQMNRIKRAVYSDGIDITYEYDPAGNITAINYMNKPMLFQENFA